MLPGASFAKNPEYFDGENIVKLAIEGGCNAVATTFGAFRSFTEIRPPHPIHRQNQSQRIVDHAKPVRPSHVRLGA